MNSPAYMPSAESMRVSLPDIGDRLSSQMVELHTRPDASKAEMLAIALDGARRHVLAFRERLLVAEREPVEQNAA